MLIKNLEDSLEIFFLISLEYFPIKGNEIFSYHFSSPAVIMGFIYTYAYIYIHIYIYIIFKLNLTVYI